MAMRIFKESLKTKNSFEMNKYIKVIEKLIKSKPKFKWTRMQRI